MRKDLLGLGVVFLPAVKEEPVEETWKEAVQTATAVMEEESQAAHEQ